MDIKSELESVLDADLDGIEYEPAQKPEDGTVRVEPGAVENQARWRTRRSSPT